MAFNFIGQLENINKVFTTSKTNDFLLVFVFKKIF